MSVPSEIVDLVERLNEELAQTDQEATEGVNLARKLLSRFPGNAILTQYFAYFNTIVFFVETSRKQIDTTVETLSPKDVPVEVIQDAGEELGTLLGRLLEVKINVNRMKTRLDNWQ